MNSENVKAPSIDRNNSKVVLPKKICKMPPTIRTHSAANKLEHTSFISYYILNITFFFINSLSELMNKKNTCIYIMHFVMGLNFIDKKGFHYFVHTLFWYIEKCSYIVIQLLL